MATFIQNRGFALFAMVQPTVNADASFQILFKINVMHIHTHTNYDPSIPKCFPCFFYEKNEKALYKTSNQSLTESKPLGPACRLVHLLRQSSTNEMCPLAAFFLPHDTVGSSSGSSVLANLPRIRGRLSARLFRHAY